jgi:uncharacterized protein YndB with AHSA1/START domain
MSIAPIVKSVSISLAPDRAFALFAGDIGRWWSPTMHIAPEPFVDVVIEPKAGGRWFERDAAGNESRWGCVLAWEPPGRLLLGWQLNSIDGKMMFDPEFVTEVEIRFEPEGDGSRVTLTHRNIERFGDSAERIRAQLAGGWPGLVDRFAHFAEENVA